MKRTQLGLLLAALIAILATVIFFARAEEEEPIPIEEPPQLTHQQKVWMHALEWCESRGIPEAVNEEDLDGTPSYGAFQFKPSTLDYFSEKYNVATTSLMDYESQRSVLEQMILHRDEIDWYQQFPWCVKKLGPAPAP